MSTSTGPIFTKFAGLVELWPQTNDLKLFFSIFRGTLPWQPILWAKLTSNSHLVVRMTFSRAAPPTYDEQYGQLLYTALANKLPDSMDAREPIR